MLVCFSRTQACEKIRHIPTEDILFLKLEVHAFATALGETLDISVELSKMKTPAEVFGYTAPEVRVIPNRHPLDIPGGHDMRRRLVHRLRRLTKARRGLWSLRSRYAPTPPKNSTDRQQIPT